MTDKEPSKNPFVAFKSQVDHHIATTLQGLLGIPSMVSRTFDLALGEPVLSGPATQQQPQQPRESDNPPPPNPNHQPSDPEQQLLASWLLFARHSEYSPLALRHLPRQPTPSDLPIYASTSDGPRLTFEDAFEDLLAAASGRPMPDLHGRLALRRLLRAVYSHPVLGDVGEPPRAWVRRLREQGLLGDGVASGGGGGDAVAAFPGTVESWRYGGAFDRGAGRYVWEDVEERRREETTEGSGHGDGEGRQLDWPSSGPDGGLFEKLDQVFKAIGEAFEDGADGKTTAGNRHERRRGEDGGSERLPETEEAMLSSVRSAFEQSEKSLSTFFKLMLGSSVETSSEVDPRRGGRSSAMAEKVEGQGPMRSIEEREEHVDDHGNVHTKVTIRRVNEKGEEISKETVQTLRSSRSWQWSSGGDQDASREAEDQKQDPRQSGWFWR